MRPGDFDKTRPAPVRIPKMPDRRMLPGFTWATPGLVVLSLIGLVVIVGIGFLVEWAL